MNKSIKYKFTNIQIYKSINLIKEIKSIKNKKYLILPYIKLYKLME